MFGGRPKRRQASKNKHTKANGNHENTVPGKEQASHLDQNVQPVVSARLLSPFSLPEPASWHAQASTSHTYNETPAAVTYINLQVFPRKPIAPSEMPATNSASELPNLTRCSVQNTSPYSRPTKASGQESTAQGALCDLISTKLDSILTSIDSETFTGDEKDLCMGATSKK